LANEVATSRLLAGVSSTVQQTVGAAVTSGPYVTGRGRRAATILGCCGAALRRLRGWPQCRPDTPMSPPRAARCWSRPSANPPAQQPTRQPAHPSTTAGTAARWCPNAGAPAPTTAHSASPPNAATTAKHASPAKKKPQLLQPAPTRQQRRPTTVL